METARPFPLPERGSSGGASDSRAGGRIAKASAAILRAPFSGRFPVKLLSSTDLAIAIAIRSNTLRVETKISRFGFGEFFAISDDSGLIEVQMSQAELDVRLCQIRAALQ